MTRNSSKNRRRGRGRRARDGARISRLRWASTYSIASVLEEELKESDANDFGHGIIPGLRRAATFVRARVRRLLRGCRDHPHVLSGELGPHGSAAEIQLLRRRSRRSTRGRGFSPEARSTIAPSCARSSPRGSSSTIAAIERSVIGVRSRDSEKAPRCARRARHGCGLLPAACTRSRPISMRGSPPIGIGEGAVVERAIIDKNARIGAERADRQRWRPQTEADRRELRHSRRHRRHPQKRGHPGGDHHLMGV